MSESIFIFDTSCFVITRNYYKDNFPDFWELFDGVVNSGLITSVELVKDEIGWYYEKQGILTDWINKTNKMDKTDNGRRGVFTILNRAELITLKRIHNSGDGEVLTKKRNKALGREDADAYLIARAVRYIE